MRLFFGWLLFMIVGIAQANELLTQIQAKLTSNRIVHGYFLQEKRLKFLSKPLVSDGEFWFVQQRGVIWKTLSPVASSLVMSNNRLLTERGEQSIPPSFGRVFPAMLGGDLAQLENDFAVDGEFDGNTWRISLQPKDELFAKLISTISLTGDSALRAMTITETGGNESKLQFSRISYPKNLSPEQAAYFEALSP